MRVNTAISRLIVLNNHLTTLPTTPRAAVEALVLMTAPVAPHVAEELWSRLGHDRSLAHEPRSFVLHRSEQNGRHLESGVHATGVPHIGHLTMRVLSDIRTRDPRRVLASFCWCRSRE